MTDEGDREVEGPAPVSVNGELLVPRSRTFMPSSVDDNPFLAQTGYKATLQALPEPLRSQMLRGDFLASGADDPWQVIPTEWVKAAQERWRSSKRPDGNPDALGVDPAAGGRDSTVIAKRRVDWFDELVVQPGGATPDGASVAALVVANLKGGAPAYIDVIESAPSIAARPAMRRIGPGNWGLPTSALNSGGECERPSNLTASGKSACPLTHDYWPI